MISNMMRLLVLMLGFSTVLTHAIARGRLRSSNIGVRRISSARTPRIRGTAVMVAAAATKGSEAAALKRQLVNLCAGTRNGTSSSREQLALIRDLAQQLGKFNPTKAPARSPLIAGKWRLLFSDVPGPSSGTLGPFVGDVFQDIRPDEKRITNVLELGPSWAIRGALEADIAVIDDANWGIKFDFVYNTFAGKELSRKKFEPDFQRRIWQMTYLDSDFRVVFGRIEGADPDDSFIFVLQREE